MNGICIKVEIDGYVNKLPYHITEFEPKAEYWENMECNLIILRKSKSMTPLDKWVWTIINYNSDPSVDDGFPMFLFHISPKQIAELIGETEENILTSLSHLILLGRIKAYDIEGKSDLYVAI